MGAWGYGYRENDNYYNRAGEFVQPLFRSLQEAFDEGSLDLPDLRAHLLWTVNLLKGAEEEVVLSLNNLMALRSFVKYLRKISRDFTDTEEYLEAIEEDMQHIEKWVDSFREMGFLEDRIGALLETTAQEESNGTKA